MHFCPHALKESACTPRSQMSAAMKSVMPARTKTIARRTAEAAREKFQARNGWNTHSLKTSALKQQLSQKKSSLQAMHQAQVISFTSKQHTISRSTSRKTCLIL